MKKPIVKKSVAKFIGKVRPFAGPALLGGAGISAVYAIKDKKKQNKNFSNLTQLRDGRYAYNFKDSKGGVMGVFVHGKPSLKKQKALQKHFKDFNPSKSQKNLSATYKKFPNLTTITSSKKAPVPYSAYKMRQINKKTGQVRDVIKITKELSSSWEA
jgi:NAD-dependent SIR2 family protein deacetylase